eukprot:163808_1
MDNAMKIEHTFQAPKECEDSGDEKKAPETPPEMATVCVGSTGTGKSSLINLFCKNQVRVGHGTKSETQGSALIASNTGQWLDTQGANDSSGVDDEKVLTDILKQLHDSNVNEIKVVWCVSGDMCREKQEFQSQARFIQSLGKGVWDSCLIIKKKGDPRPDEMDGVVAAARRYGANISECNYRHLYGYTGLEFGDLSKDRLLKRINKIKDDATRKEELLECGYLTNTEIVSEISGKLSKLSPLHIHFENKECSKCGQRGDPRFVYAPCHTESEKHHSKPTVSYHPKGTVKYHPSPTLQYFHPKKVTYFHPGYVQKKYHHPGHKKSIYYHPEGSYWNFFKHGDSDWRWKCCEKLKYYSSGSKKDNGCTFAHDKWTCCGYSGSSGPCTSYYAYSCCGKSESSQGCQLGFECCHRDTTDRGCTQEYGCCKSPSDEGCTKKYLCCNAPSENKGCKQKYECCDKDLGEEGCGERCKACQKEWGKGPGCVKTSKKESC